MIELIKDVFLWAGDSLGDGANCNSYIIKSNDEVLLVDSAYGVHNRNWGFNPSRDPLDLFMNVIDKYKGKINMLALTHAHLDHVGGVSSLNEDYRNKINVGSHKNEAIHLEDGHTKYIDPITRKFEHQVKIDSHLSNGDKIKVGEHSFEVLHTAGHTEGSMCLYEPENKWLFSGDTVFPQGSFGRVDFPGSNPDDMLVSLDTIRSLEVNCLFAGHMKPIIGPQVNQSLEFSYRNAKYMF